MSGHKAARLFDRLTKQSVQKYTNPYSELCWEEELPTSAYWMPPSLLSIAGTNLETELEEEQKKRLSQLELINFFSFNQKGEGHLVQAVIERLNRPSLGLATRYFHHFIDEENKHMWFFGEFCRRYHGGFYSNKALKIAPFQEPDIEDFVTFAKILIFECMGDYFNVRIARDESIPTLIRTINQMHHADESRHIAMGRELLCMLHEELRKKYSSERILEIETYLRRYMQTSISLFYQPKVYLDVEMPDPFRLRIQLLQNSTRAKFHEDVFQYVVSFFVKERIFSPGVTHATEAPNTNSS